MIGGATSAWADCTHGVDLCKCPRWGSNPRQAVLETAALPLSYEDKPGVVRQIVVCGCDMPRVVVSGYAGEPWIAHCATRHLVFPPPWRSALVVEEVPGRRRHAQPRLRLTSKTLRGRRFSCGTCRGMPDHEPHGEGEEEQPDVVGVVDEKEQENHGVGFLRGRPGRRRAPGASSNGVWGAGVMGTTVVPGVMGTICVGGRASSASSGSGSGSSSSLS